MQYTRMGPVAREEVAAIAMEDRREALLRAAIGVFLRQGYQGASVKAITEAAGCATGTFYLYFPSKDDCLSALIDRLYERVLAAVAEARSWETAVGDKLWVSIEAAVRVFEREGELAAVVLRDAPGASPLFRERMNRVRGTLAQLIAEDLAEVGMGEWERDCAARMLEGALGEVLVWQMGTDAAAGHPQRLWEAGQVVRRLFWRGCGFEPRDSAAADPERPGQASAAKGGR
jgi:AcrR family transcriptional regulator